MNAEELLADATVLFDHERYPRAYALAELALEEFAKSIDLFAVLITSLLGLELPESGWNHFWQKWPDHEFKTMIGLTGNFLREWSLEMAQRAESEGWTELPPDLDNTLRGLSANLNLAAAGHRDLARRRLRALYVDYLDGEIVRPSEEIDRESAKTMLDFTRRNVEFLGTVPDWSQIQQLAAFLSQQGIGPVLMRLFSDDSR